MKNYSFKLENTLKVEIVSKNGPSDSEILKYLIDAGLDLGNVIGFHKSNEDLSFFIKFVNGEVLRIGMELLSLYGRMEIKGITCFTNISILDGFLANIFLQHIPFEIPDEVILQKLSKYGTVLSIKWQKLSLDSNNEIYNGIREVEMRLNKVVPPYISILDMKVRAFFYNQKLMCYHCCAISHHRKDCTMREKKSSSTCSANIEDFSTNMVMCSNSEQLETTTCASSSNYSSHTDTVDKHKRRKKKRPKLRRCNSVSKSTQTTIAQPTEQHYDRLIKTIDEKHSKRELTTFEILNIYKRCRIPVEDYHFDRENRCLMIQVGDVVHEYNFFDDEL